MKKKVILMIIDGFGYGEKNITNPFRISKTPNLDYFKKNYPFCLLTAHGYAVGLPPNEPASCEVGHLTIGIGNTYYHPKVRIDLEIESGNFFKNETLNQIFVHARKFNSRIHLIGLLTYNWQKASLDHLLNILRKAKNENFVDVYLHLFTDGLESPPQSALILLKELDNIQKKENLPGKIATLCGRFYALDETKNYFLRTQRAFLLISQGLGNLADDPFKLLEKKYQENEFSDDLLEPTIFLKKGIINNNDAILFFNYESKSISQLAEAFLDPNFKEFPRPKKENLFIASIVKYLNNLNYPVMFEEQKITTNLSRVITENKLKQLKIIDEKRKSLLSFYFNGFFEEERYGEVYKIISDFETPEKDLIEKTKEMLDYLTLSVKEGVFDLIVISLPIFEIVAQKGNFNLAIKAIEAMDNFLGEFYNFLKSTDYALIITADHGNIEKLFDFSKNQKEKTHTTSPVPFHLIHPQFKREKSENEISNLEKKPLGSLIDIVPTILDLLNLKILPEFKGKSLLKYL
jgi:2,3-bisphosphoglycerate-independent phosphoglycerate mutase